MDDSNKLLIYLLFVVINFLFSNHFVSCQNDTSVSSTSTNISIPITSWMQEFSFLYLYYKFVNLLQAASYNAFNMSSSIKNSVVHTNVGKIPSRLANESSTWRFCGLPDDIPSNDALHKKVKRYVLEGTKWEKLEVSWAIAEYSKSRVISKGEIVGDLRTAFKLWSDVSKIRFKEVHPSTPNIDITIGFHTGSHGDSYPFDGPGQTLAHAFYPASGGDIHFDDSEDFRQHVTSIRDGVGTSFLVTAAHELGHSLGLHHSNVYSALMAPFYQSYPQTFVLPDDDVRAIQALYGSADEGFIPITYAPPKTTTTTTTTQRTTKVTRETTPIWISRRRTPTPRPWHPRPFPVTPITRHTPYYPRPSPRPSTPYNYPPTTQSTTTTNVMTPPPYHPSCLPKSVNTNMPDTCGTSFDSVTVFRRELFFFKDKYMWRIPMRGDDYPKLIEQLFRTLADIKSIDAAYETPGAKSIVFFSGDNFYKVSIGSTRRSLETGKLVDLGINSSRVDAAMIWGHNGHIYVFSGSQYWRLTDDGRAESDYPRHMGMWRGVPNNVTAAVSIQTKTYFFVGKVFWPFDNSKMAVDGPPRLISTFFLDCPYKHAKDRRLCSSAHCIQVNSIITCIVIYFLLY